jgi:pyrimidine-nucleoside phosphorylase
VLPVAVISKKRDGLELSEAEIRFMIDGLVDGSVPDYQISAWAMAVLLNGMSEVETACLTDAMLESGGRLARASDRPRVDKHSTGGLGDKVSLVLAPLLACCEVDVPMLSGRGLGITGGTLDKLEAYSGYRCDLTPLEIDRQLQRLGCVITGTTPDIAPADKKLYLLRDVTGTVPSIPLITASIMSKKLAATLDALVLDVKFGSGAFMQDLESARRLAGSLQATGERMGVDTRVILSDMNQPLGRMVGNACEANEAVQILQGQGPSDVRQLTLALGAELLVAIGRYQQTSLAVTALAEMIDNGAALRRYQLMIEMQGGEYKDQLPLAASSVLTSSSEGWLAGLDGQLLGQAVIELGGGRRKLGDRIDATVGLEMLVRIGDRIEHQQPLVKIFSASNATSRKAAYELLESAFSYSSEPVPPLPLIVSEGITAS